MSERYSRLFTLPENLYAVSSPIVIAAGTLLKDNQTGKIVAQLKLKSISTKAIKAVKVKLDLFDTAGNALEESVVHDYLDLNVARDVEFGQKNPIMVPNFKVRSYKAAVTEVVFADRSVWTGADSKWEPLSKPSRLTFHDYEMQKQYEIMFGGGSVYEAKAEKDVWYCTCGALNHAEENCHICHHSLFELQTLDMAALAAEKDARLTQEREAAEAKAAAERAAAEAAKKKTAKILKITIPVVCAVVAITLLVTKVVIPNSKYNDAVALMEAKKYEEAIAAFEAMGDYKDSAEQIANCEAAVVAEEQARIETANSAAYADAEELATNGETAKAAITFGKLGDYQDAREKSYALWDTILVRKTVDVGGHFTVGLQNNGKMRAVGNNEHNQTRVHEWKDIKAVSAGYFHTIGMKSDGSLIGIGWNDKYGQCNVRSWENIVSVSAGGYHTVGLKSDGTVVAVGCNEDGNRCDVEDWEDIVAISAGGYHTVGLQSDGTVVAVGYSDNGQCKVSGWKNAVAISAGHRHTVALKADGTVVATGDNEYGQCNVSGWRDIVAIDAGLGNTVGLKSDGTVVAVGENSYGQCNISDWKNIVAISTTNCTVAGLRANGTVVAIGRNDYGQCDVSNWKDIKLPN